VEVTQSFQFFEHPLGYFWGVVFGFHSSSPLCR
jgi:hypothetical protein